MIPTLEKGHWFFKALTVLTNKGCYNPPSCDHFTATNIFVLDLQNNHQIIGDHRKLILEEKKVIICCLNCTEIIRSTLLISQREKMRRCLQYSMKRMLNSVGFLLKHCSIPLSTSQLLST